MTTISDAAQAGRSAAATASGSSAGKAGSPWLMLIVLLAGQFMALLDSSAWQFTGTSPPPQP